MTDAPPAEATEPAPDRGAGDHPTKLYLVRHGESQVTVRRVVGGPRSCTGLSTLGRRQATALRERLATTGEVVADVLYASAYPRAIETAETIAPALHLDVQIDEGFGEHDPGPECDGLSFDEFVERYGVPDWEGDPHGASFPGGETVAEFHLRVGRTLSRVVERHRGCSVVVVCHGGVIDVAMRVALRSATTGGFELHTRNTSITELTLVRPGRWRLERYNDTTHLHGLPSETPRTEAR